MLRTQTLSCSFTLTHKTPPLFFFSFFNKFPHNNPHTLRPLLHHHNNKTTTTTNTTTSLFNNVSSFSINNNSHYLSTLSATTPIHNPSSSNNTTPTLSKKAMRKAHRQSPKGLLKHNLDMCSKHDDLIKALRLYDEAQRDGVNLTLHNYNVLLYLYTLDGERGSNLQKGFEIFQSMVMDKVVPNEVTFTKWITISPNC